MNADTTTQVTIPATTLSALQAERDEALERRDHWHDYSARRVEDIAALTAERDALRGRLGELSRELLLTWNLPHHVKQSAVDRIAQELGRMALTTSSAAQGEGDGRG